MPIAGILSSTQEFGDAISVMTAGPGDAIAPGANAPQNSDGEWVSVPGMGPLQRNTATGFTRMDPAKYRPGEYGPGRDSYGLTDGESIVVARAADPKHAGNFVTIAEGMAIRDAGLGPHTDINQGNIVVPGATIEAKQAFVAKLEETHPLPTTINPPVLAPASVVAKEAELRPISAGIISPLNTHALVEVLPVVNRTVGPNSLDLPPTDSPSNAAEFFKVGLFLAGAGAVLLALRHAKH
jgi:hypothetical protein